MFERRHRLYSHEIPQVLRGLKLRLQELCEAREDREAAEIAFQALYRLTRTLPGRPKYPEFHWDQVEDWVNEYDAMSQHRWPALLDPFIRYGKRTGQ